MRTILGYFLEQEKVEVHDHGQFHSDQPEYVPEHTTENQNEPTSAEETKLTEEYENIDTTPALQYATQENQIPEFSSPNFAVIPQNVLESESEPTPKSRRKSIPAKKKHSRICYYSI
jgi:hypothetical protein